MSICFSTLNTSKYSNSGKSQFKKCEPGVYKAKIVKAEPKTSKVGNEYLSIRLDLMNCNGNKCGVMFEMLMDNGKAFCQYKLRKFLEAVKIPCEGEMELSDLAVLVTDKEVVVWAQEEEYNGQTNLRVNMRDADGFYPIEQYAEIKDTWNKVNGGSDGYEENNDFMNVPETENEELPFDEEF